MPAANLQFPRDVSRRKQLDLVSLFIVAALALPPFGLRAQDTNDIAAVKRQRDSLIRVDLRRWMDSLDAGRRRWKRAGIRQYVIQSHYDCMCLLTDTASLLTVRGTGIVGRTRNGALLVPEDRAWTVDSLFDVIARDMGGETHREIEQILDRPGFAQQYVRRVQKLQLHPLYGFP